MNVLDRTGHLTVNWDVDNADEVKTAREMFDAMRAKGYSAFTVRGKKRNKPGDKLTAFDADVEEMILTPPIAGG